MFSAEESQDGTRDIRTVRETSEGRKYFARPFNDFFRYFALINRLTSRYINRVEDCTTENRDITTEDINNAKSEIIGHQQLL